MDNNKAYAQLMRDIAKADINGILQVSTALWKDIADIIENSVEVVRCKDCRIGKGNTPKMGAGWIYCENNGQYHKETHFCGYGERRSDNEPT